MSPIREATVTIDGDSLNSVRSFVYLGSAINTGPPPPDNEINKIKKPTAGAERVSGSSPSARSIEWFASQRWSMLWNLHHNTVGIPSACQVCSAVICDTSCISRRKTPPPPIQTFLSEQTCQIWKLCWRQRDCDELGIYVVWTTIDCRKWWWTKMREGTAKWSVTPL